MKIKTPDNELNRVLGGGIVLSAVILIGGEPGIGKSTLLFQLVLNMKDVKSLYISGEESMNQIKLRAKRFGIANKNCLLYVENNIENILTTIDEQKPQIIVIDSIQTLTTADIDALPGSISQIRECSNRIIQKVKEKNITVFLVGHITKEGYIAGPKVLEHMVDTVLHFEGDRNYDYRIVRTLKNRFGSTSEIGIYQMSEKGLMEVKNPSEILISNRDLDISGISIAATVEGIRSLLIEVQALVTISYYGNPQRNTTGFYIKRLSMLIAVLEKRLGLKLGNQDIFVNIAGGIKVDDPSIDLSVIMAIASSYYDKEISSNICFAGEVGLSGEIRHVRYPEKRIAEADKLGFKKIFVANAPSNKIVKTKNIEVVKVTSVNQLMGKIF